MFTGVKQDMQHDANNHNREDAWADDLNIATKKDLATLKKLAETDDGVGKIIGILRGMIDEDESKS